MAKKSAKSKGYRKTYAKRPYLTKKEIIAGVSIVVALILAVILFNIFYDDGSLDVVDGVAVAEGNSLIVNRGASTAPRYFKLGQVAEVEGYTLEGTPAIDANLVSYTYTPEAESLIDSILFETYNWESEGFCGLVHSSVSAYEGVELSETASTEASGHDVHYFYYTKDNTVITGEEASDETDEAAETEEVSETDETSDIPHYVQELAAFVHIDDESCIALLVRNNAESEEELVEENVMVETMDQFLAALSFETK